MDKKTIEFVKGKNKIIVRIRDEENGPIVEENFFNDEKEAFRYLQKFSGDSRFRLLLPLQITFKEPQEQEQIKAWADTVSERMKAHFPEEYNCSLIFHDKAWKQAYGK